MFTTPIPESTRKDQFDKSPAVIVDSCKKPNISRSPSHHYPKLWKMKKQLFAIASAFLISWVRAWDGSERDCSAASVCLTSFIWCDLSSPMGSCYYPEGVYPVDSHTQATIIALVVEDVDHIISWKVQPNLRDIPVRVQWQLGKGLTWEVSKCNRTQQSTVPTIRYIGAHQDGANQTRRRRRSSSTPAVSSEPSPPVSRTRATPPPRGPPLTCSIA